MVDSCFQVAAFCICASILAVLLRQYCREQSLLLSLASCVIVIGAFIVLLSPVVQNVTQLFSKANIPSDYISLIFKAIAICFVTQITSDICRDSGETAIASAAELWGRGSLTVMAIPLIEVLINMISDFLK